VAARLPMGWRMTQKVQERKSAAVTGTGMGHAKRRLWMALAGCALALTMAPLSYQAESRLQTAVHIEGGEAEGVEQELASRFASPYTHRVVVVIEGLPDTEMGDGRDALQSVVDSFRAEPGVEAVLSQLDWPDPVFQGKDGGTLILVGLHPKTGTDESLIPALKARTRAVEAELRKRFPAAKLELTGDLPLNFDLRKVSSNDVKTAELRVLPATLILLVLAFGSLAAAMLPLGAGLLAIATSMGAAALLSYRMDLSILFQNLATMLGLGLGIDYALLMVSRFREALLEGAPAGEAADIAALQAGKTLAISASTVAIGFAALAWVPISELRSIGVAGLMVSGISLALCILLLPFVLGKLGTRIDALSIRKLKLPGWFQTTGHGNDAQGKRWRVWAMRVTARPWKALILAGTPLLLLGYQAHRLKIGLPTGDWLPQQAESVHALNVLSGMGRDGIVQSLRVVVELPEGTTVRSEAGWRAVSRLTQLVKDDKRTAEVISLPALTDMAKDSSAIDGVDEAIRHGLLRDDGGAALIEVLPASNVSSNALVDWVRELRGMDLAAATGVAGTKLRIGGISAGDADYEDTVNRRMPWVVAGVVAGSLLALLVGLKSLFAAVKAVLLNLFSVGASFGALVLVFQEGYGGALFGLHGGVGQVFAMVPVIAFAIVFGLSMDYEVFLVARVLEERRKGLSEREAVAHGVASTAGLITSAAAIMIVVFAAFTGGSFLVVKMLGFTLAVAVLIDATVVRMIIGPALLQLAGDWNWWPYGLAGSEMRRGKGK
jgi:RND superfamily putative drug exporter